MRAAFTAAENATAALILDGKSNAEIAKLLNIKPRTLQDRLERMRHKWRAHSDRHLVLMLIAEQ